MKATIKLIIISICLSSIFTSCDPVESLDPTHEILFTVKNNTNNKLYIESTFTLLNPLYSTIGIGWYHDYLIIEKDSSKLISMGSRKKDETDFFSTFLEHTNDSIRFYNQDSSIVKVYARLNANESGKQFFRESDWSCNVWKKMEQNMFTMTTLLQ